VKDSREDQPRSEREDRPSRDRGDRGDRERKPRRSFGGDVEMETFRIEVGHAHGVKPGNIVGAIANETGIDGDHIARIKISDTYSTVELPAGMPKELIQELKKIRVAGQLLNISKMDGSKLDDGEKKVDKSKKRISSTSRRAKPKVE
jgi:ATP-dependent RNA helicase DeaD